MRTLVIIVVGAMLGAVSGQFFGAVVGAVLAWLLLSSTRQAGSIAQLRAQLQELQQRQIRSASQRLCGEIFSLALD